MKEEMEGDVGRNRRRKEWEEEEKEGESKPYIIDENSKKQRMTTSGKFKYPLTKELHHKKSYRFMPLKPL